MMSRYRFASRFAASSLLWSMPFRMPEPISFPIDSRSVLSSRENDIFSLLPAYTAPTTTDSAMRGMQASAETPNSSSMVASMELRSACRSM
ncbi:hypothetical protein DSECCO2_548310 [anaerobic digester metagenome]